MEHVTEGSFPQEAVSSYRIGVSCINTSTGLGLWPADVLGFRVLWTQTTWTLNIFI